MMPQSLHPARHGLSSLLLRGHLQHHHLKVPPHAPLDARVALAEGLLLVNGAGEDVISSQVLHVANVPARGHHIERLAGHVEILEGHHCGHVHTGVHDWGIN